MNQIYFDNGSTSWPKAPGVPEAMADLLAHGAFNINRGNYEGAYEIEGVELEKIAAKYVLDNISASYDRTSGLVARAYSSICL